MMTIWHYKMIARFILTKITTMLLLQMTLHPIKCPQLWNQRVIDNRNPTHIIKLLEHIGKQELEGGHMRTRQLSVLHKDRHQDMRLPVENYSVASLASTLCDHEDLLQQRPTFA